MGAHIVKGAKFSVFTMNNKEGRIQDFKIDNEIITRILGPKRVANI